jgi:hypothetical protein
MRKGFSSRDEYNAHLLMEQEQDKARVLRWQQQMREQKRPVSPFLAACIFVAGLFLIGVVTFFLWLRGLHFGN